MKTVLQGALRLRSISLKKTVINPVAAVETCNA